MTAVVREGADQYRVLFDELGRRGLALLRPRTKAHVDPYLVGRAVAEVMRACTVRSALGSPLLWNEYRVVLSRADFEPLRALHATLDRDLAQVLAAEVERRGAELVGALRIALVVDEADELEPGRAVVRVAFVPTDGPSGGAAGESTLHLDPGGAARSPAPDDATVHLAETAGDALPGIVLRWPFGEAAIPAGVPFVVGRPHADPPARFVALTGASTRISKQHLVVTAGPGRLHVGRLPSANPVQVGGRALCAGEEIEAATPVEISLSRGEVVLSASEATGERG